jgi:hypothetical protein
MTLIRFALPELIDGLIFVLITKIMLPVLAYLFGRHEHLELNHV